MVGDLELATNSWYLHMTTHDKCPFRGFLGGMRLTSPSLSSFILACQKQGVKLEIVKSHIISVTKFIGTNELGHRYHVTLTLALSPPPPTLCLSHPPPPTIPPLPFTLCLYLVWPIWFFPTFSLSQVFESRVFIANWTWFQPWGFLSIESRVFIENWKWVSKGCGSYLIHPGKPLTFPPL